MKKVLSLFMALVMATSVTAGIQFSGYAVDCTHENTELRNAAEATYTTEGYTGDLVCLDCEEVLEEGQTIPVLERKGWVEIDGVWYHYTDEQVMETGFITLPSGTYYLGEDGAMQTGWVEIEGKSYYFKESGPMQTGWQKIDNKWYYLGEDGVMQTGWIFSEGSKKWFYLNENGVMQTGWVFSEGSGKWFFMNKNGVMQTGWVKSPNSGKWFYMNENGAMQTGWRNVNGKRYYLGDDGAMRTGWQKINNKWYYFNSSGAMQKGWVKVSGEWYYCSGSGIMQTGWIKLSGKWYYLGYNGVMRTGWQKISGKWYFFNSSGVWTTGWNNVYASYSSDYVNNYNRTRNLELASEAIDGVVIYPGEIFDFNRIVGPRTSSKGYLPAPVFTGTTGHEDGIGGGICQVSSTIFNAVLYANLDIVERHQHSQKVYYVPFGRDAAMSGTVCNFRWKNNSDHAIKVRMNVSGGVITCTLYTVEHVSPADVSLSVSRSGNTYTLRRYVNGRCNYTTSSTY